ncbi:MAG: hypothetical protein ACRDJS_01325 [Actinomycetota bacterium]
MGRLKGLCTVTTLALVAGTALAPAAAAATAKPSIIAQAWYWESQRNENVDTPAGTVAGEAPNPFCPAAPGSLGAPSDTCAAGRLPVQVVNGDYKTPEMLSAVNFDFTMVPPGSKVSKFTLTMLEAESGCYNNKGTDTGKQCEETDARNIDGKQIQACLVSEIIGDGEARPYKERPKFKCTNADPVAKRKEIRNDAKADPNDTDKDHVWTFDLTSYAQKWAKTFSVNTSVLLFPKEPKKAGGNEVDWRVVFAGPKFKHGVKTQVVFTPPAGGLGALPGGGLPGTTGFTDTGSGGFTSTTGDSGDFGSGSASTGLPTTSSGSGGGASTTPGEPVDTGGEQQPTAAEAPKVQAMPAYVWLAILAGLVGFSLLRSFVLERGAGPRPDGVLAQIHKLNAEGRGGTAVGGAGAGAFGVLIAGLGSVGRRLAPVGSKLVEFTSKLKPRRK